MTIGSGDIKFLKSEVFLDTSDGGGRVTATEVVDGVSNNMFPDISELDRTYGRVSLRKVYVAVDTSTGDSYYGSHMIVSKMPADPRVSVTIFSTQDWFDRRTEARDKIERYLARGPKWAGHLLEMQIEGSRAIQLALRLTDEEPKVGQGLVLVQFEGLPSEYEQYVRVTKITSVERVFTVGGKDVIRKVCTVDISDPLRYDFEGPSVQEFENGNLGKAFCRDTRVANAANYYGISKLTTAGALNDASISVESIFAQLVPSAQSETPMVDLTAASLSSLYVPGNTGTITSNFTAPMGPTTKVYLGIAVLPGTLSLVAGPSTIVDSAGDIKIGSTIVGFIEYDKGLLNFNANAPVYSGAMAATFTPAGVPTRVQDTAAIGIVQDARGYNYTITLLPIPQPGSLVVSYMSQGKVYFLYDRGNGALKGSDAAFGSGSISYITGSVIITTGALPDADSEIIFAWGKATTTFTRAGLPISPAKIVLQLANQQIAPGTYSVTWPLNSTTKTATDDGNGNITGDATGKINYSNGQVTLVPTLLPQAGTSFSSSYQWGTPNEVTLSAGTRVGNQVVITLPSIGGNIIPKTLELNWSSKVDTPGNIGATSTTQTFQPPFLQVFGAASR